MDKNNQIPYEKMLNFNAVLTWVHSLRYRETIKILKKFGQRKINILEIGCAHAPLFEVLNKKFDIEYSAIEYDAGFCEEAKKRHGHHSNFKVINGDAANPDCYKSLEKPDVVICLETLEHVPQGQIEKILSAICSLGKSKFICSVPVEIGPAVLLKNLASVLFRYHRHNNYTWRETLWASIYRLDKLPPHAGCHKGFDWRNLIKKINEKMRISEIKRLPFRVLPCALSNSIFITAEGKS